MRTCILFIFTSFLFVASLSAQRSPLASATTPAAKTTAPALFELAKLAQEHNVLAAAQISDYLSEHLVYPKEMENCALEGTITLRVSISRSGRLSTVKLLDTELPKAFTKTALKVLEQFEGLDLKGNTFLGRTYLNVPLHFSL